MSQRRLIVSLALVSSCLALVIALAAWTFPLKAQGVAGGVAGGIPGGVAQGVSGGVTQGVSRGVAQGISNGVARGVSNGIANGIKGGISGIKGSIATFASADDPNVDYSTIWTDTVRRGAMPLQARGLGTLARAEGSNNFVAKVTIVSFLAADVRENQNATVETHKGPVKGHVITVNPSSSDETRAVNIALDGPLPAGISPEAGKASEVDATVDIGKLDNVLFVGRPANGKQNSEVSLFKITNNGAGAVRTQVKLGRSSVNTIEILDGLKEGDKIILSDMSAVANAERIRLTDDNHVAKH